MDTPQTCRFFVEINQKNQSRCQEDKCGPPRLWFTLESRRLKVPRLTKISSNGNVLLHPAQEGETSASQQQMFNGAECVHQPQTESEDKLSESSFTEKQVLNTRTETLKNVLDDVTSQFGNMQRT